MADGGDWQTRRYSAFISYAHDDAAFARQLHGWIEAYRLPARLGATQSRRLRPIFLDRAELAAGGDLTDAVCQAIEQSDQIIVVCSPHSVRSYWVGLEIAHFQRTHPTTGTLAALIDGEPEEAFPPALTAPAPGRPPVQPLAADFRRDGDGPRLALLKLIAALAGVRLDELIQRDAKRRRERLAIAGGGATAILAVVGALGFSTISARLTEARARARGLALIENQLTEMRDELKKGGRLELVDAPAQSAILYLDPKLQHLSDAELAVRAQALQAACEDKSQSGDFVTERADAAEALNITKGLLRARPRDPQRIYNQAQSVFWNADVDLNTGDAAAADAEVKAYAALADKLVQIDPKNPKWLMEVGYANANLGIRALRHTVDPNRAFTYFTVSLAGYEGAASYRHNDVSTLRHIAADYGRLGDAERLRGNCGQALADRLRQRKILQNISAGDARDVQITADLAFGELGLARVELCLGAVSTAVDELDAARAQTLSLLQNDPENLDYRMEIRAIDLFRVRTWMGMPATQAPPDLVIAGVLGSCSDDVQLSKNGELTAFCTVLQARRLARNGDLIGARAMIQQLLSDERLLNRGLTDHWGLDMQNEMRQIPFDQGDRK